MVQIIRGSTSRGAHICALHAGLLAIEDLLESGPTHKRVALRDHRMALERAYPSLLLVTDSDIAQHLAEIDGDPHDDQT